MPKSLFDKIWDAHEVAPGLLYIDLHLVHEVTSPQAFDGLRLGRPPGPPPRPDAGHGRSQRSDGRHTRGRPDQGRAVRVQVETLERNCEEFGIPLYSLGLGQAGDRPRDRPRARRDAAGHDDRLRRLAHRHPRRVRGAGVRDRHERGRARARDTQCLVQSKPRSMLIRYDGELGFGVTAKDLILATIGQMGVDGAAGHVVEYAGPAIESLTMEGRMTVCNMTIEGGDGPAWSRPTRRPSSGCSERRPRPPTLPGGVVRAPQRRRMRASTARSRSTPRRSARW